MTALMQATNSLVKFDNLTLGYERHPAVHHLHGKINAGDLIAVVGLNGGGKSTLLKALMAEIRPLGGAINWPQGKPRVAYLPQRARLDLDFPLRVDDFVSLGHWPRRGVFAGMKTADQHKVNLALEQVGLVGFHKRALNSLSGGQLQRVLFARLLLEDAPLLLLDEPFAAVDEYTTADLLALIKAWHQQGRTLVAVLHDLHQVRSHFPKCLLLAKDCLGFGATDQVLTPANLALARQAQVLADPLAPVCNLD